MQRLTFYIDDEDWLKVRKLFPFGIRNVYRILTSQLIEGIERNGESFLSLVATGCIGIGFNKIVEKGKEITNGLSSTAKKRPGDDG